jgi:hypothetical protein
LTSAAPFLVVGYRDQLLDLGCGPAKLAADGVANGSGSQLSGVQKMSPWPTVSVNT